MVGELDFGLEVSACSVLLEIMSAVGLEFLCGTKGWALKKSYTDIDR